MSTILKCECLVWAQGHLQGLCELAMNLPLCPAAGFGREDKEKEEDRKEKEEKEKEKTEGEKEKEKLKRRKKEEEKVGE